MTLRNGKHASVLFLNNNDDNDDNGDNDYD